MFTRDRGLGGASVPSRWWCSKSLRQRLAIFLHLIRCNISKSLERANSLFLFLYFSSFHPIYGAAAGAELRHASQRRLQSSAHNTQSSWLNVKAALRCKSEIILILHGDSNRLGLEKGIVALCIITMNSLALTHARLSNVSKGVDFKRGGKLRHAGLSQDGYECVWLETVPNVVLCNS
jgi:hypothetical protein